MSPRADPLILNRFRADAHELYGARLDRIVLFGSRARGDSRPDSDYDIAVFLRDMTDRTLEIIRLADLGTDILYDLGQVIHAIPFSAGSHGDRTPIMGEIRRDGVTL